MDSYVADYSLFDFSNGSRRSVECLINAIERFFRGTPKYFNEAALDIFNGIRGGTRPLDHLHGQFYVYFDALAVFSHIWIMIIKAGYKDILDDYGIFSIIRHNPQYSAKLCSQICPKTTAEYFEYILRNHFLNRKYQRYDVPKKIMSEIPIKTQTLYCTLSNIDVFAKGTCAQTVYEITGALYKLCSDYVAN